MPQSGFEQRNGTSYSAYPSNLLPGGIQGWPSGRAPQSEAEQILSEAVGWWDCTSGFKAGDRWLRNRGTGGQALDLRLGSSQYANTNDPLFLEPETSGYVYLPGSSSNYLTTSSAVTTWPTGDIDIRVKVAMDDWTPAAHSHLAAKYQGGAGASSWYMRLNTDGTLLAYWTPDSGTTSRQVSSTAAVSVADGSALWVRWTLDVDNGAGQYDARFYTSSDGETWAQLGTTITGTTGTTAIGACSTDPLFGSLAGSGFSAGRFYRVQIRNGIDGPVVLDIDCDAITSGSQTSFQARTGQTVTINRATSGRKTVAMPSKTVKKIDDGHVYLPGTWANYLSVPDETALDITGDIDIRVCAALDTPTVSLQDLLSKWSASNQSYWLWAHSGYIRFWWSNDGSATLSAESTVPFPTGTTWFRATLDVDNGASGKTVTFYTSLDGVTWTQLGNTVVTAGTTSIYSGTGAVGIGANIAAGRSAAPGRFYRAQVYNGINGTLVLDVDCSKAPASFEAGKGAAFAAVTGQTVTLNSTANSGMLVRQERWGAGRAVMLFGTDDYMEVQDDQQHRILNLDTATSATMIFVARQFPTQSNYAGLMTKSTYYSAGSAGWSLFNVGTTYTARWSFTDANLSGWQSIATAYTAGKKSCIGVVMRRAQGNGNGFVDETAGSSSAMPRASDFASSIPLRVGKESQSSAAYADLEFTAAAVFRRALTPAEIKILSDYYAEGGQAKGQSQPDAVKTLESAAFWIDAERSSVSGSKIKNLGTGGVALDAMSGSTPGVDAPVYNLLTANQASIETGTTGLKALDSCTISRSTAQSASGTASLAATATSTNLTVGTGGYTEASPPATLTSITAGKPYTATVTVRAPSAKSGWVRLTWYTSAGGSPAASGNVQSASASLSSGTWTTLTVSGIAPAGAVYASVVTRVSDSANGEVYYFDKFGLWEGWGGDWQLPGTPITNVGSDTNDPKYLAAEDKGYVYLPGVAGNYLTVADEPALRIAGDIDIRVQVALDNWASGIAQNLLCKAAQVGSLNSIAFYVNTGGTLVFRSYPDATIPVSMSSDALNLPNGALKWVRVTWDSDNGAGGSTARFYTSDDGVSWTKIGSDVTVAGTLGTAPTNVPVSIGGNSGGTAPITGKVYRAIVKNGIDGPTVLDIDCNDITSASATSFTAKTGQTVAINRATSGRKAVVVNRYNGGGNRWLFGTDDYMEVANRYMALSGAGYIKLPGVSTAYLSVPDEASLRITGDIDIRVRVAMDDWTPASTQGFLYKAVVNGQFAYQFQISPAGALQLQWWPTGLAASSITKSSTVNNTIPDGTVKWVRATLDVDNGASGNDVAFYTSDDGITWTQLGTTVTTAGTTSLYAGTDPVHMSSSPNLAGRVYQAQVFNGIGGTKVLDIDTSVAVSGATTFTAVTGQTVTVNGACTQVPFPYVYLPGIAGNYLSVPDEVALRITGDLDIRAKVTMDTWVPSGTIYLLAKNQNTLNSYQLTINTSGNLILWWSADGTNWLSATSSAATAVVAGGTKWVRATLDVDNGASGYDVKFYLSDDGSSWSQLGTTQTASGVTSIYSSAAPVGIGATAFGSSPISGRIHRAQVFNGIAGTKVLDVDTSVCKDDSITTFTALTGQTVTINRAEGQYKSKVITQAGYMMPWYPYTFIPSSVDLLNFGASDSFTVVAAIRYWNGISTSRNIVGKSASTGTTPSWNLNFASASLIPRLSVYDAVTNLSTVGPTAPAGAMLTLAGTANRNSQQVTVFDNGIAGNPQSYANVGSTSAWIPMRIGTYTDGTSLAIDMELYAVAVFRRALSAAEIKSIDDWYRKRGAVTFIADSDSVRKAYLSAKLGTSDDAVLSILKDAVFHVDAKAYASGSQYVENLGWRKDALNARLGSGQGVDTNDPLWLGAEATGYVYVAATGNNLTVPSTGTSWPTGDMDVRVLVAADDYTPTSTAYVAGKLGSAGNRQFYLVINTNGRPALVWSPDGTATITATATAAPAVVDGDKVWLRWTLDADNGAGQYEVAFYTSSNGSTWSKIGDTVIGSTGVTSIYAGTASMFVGTVDSGSNHWTGRYYRVVMYSDLAESTKILDIDCDAITSGAATSFTATTGQTVTINRSTSGRKAVAMPSVAKGGRACFLFGTDDYMEVEGDVQHDLLNFGAGESFTVMTIQRIWHAETHKYALGKVQGDLVGYVIDLYNGTSLPYVVDTLGNVSNPSSVAVPLGSVTQTALVGNRTNATLYNYVNAASTSKDMSAVKSLSHTRPLWIGGGAGTSANFAAMELRAALVFRRALTAQEITTLSNYYSGG